MPSTIQAHLLYQGHACEIGEIVILNEVWISHNLRPDLPVSEYLPDIGDLPLSSNILSSQSIVINYLAETFCKKITEQEYLEGNVRGTIYTVQYDNIQEPTGGWTDPTNDDNNVVLNIACGAQVDTYVLDSADPKSTKLYAKIDGSYKQAVNPVTTKTTALINVSTTKRVRDKTMTQIIGESVKAGKVNASTMWSIPAGCILFNGATAQPIQELDTTDTSKTKLTWNVTKNYTIKYIPGAAYANEPTWQHVWYEGTYTKLYKDAQGSAYLTLYATDTLPNDIP